MPVTLMAISICMGESASTCKMSKIDSWLRKVNVSILRYIFSLPSEHVKVNVCNICWLTNL